MPTPSLLIVPARFKSGKLYSQIPTSGAGDFTVTRATSATRVNASGLIESVASGIPRLDYFASGGTVGCPALLVEPSVQNQCQRSEEFNNVFHFPFNLNAFGSGSVANTNATRDPYGTNVADYIQENLTAGVVHGIIDVFAGNVSGTTYTWSVFAKAAERTIINLFNNAGGGGSATFNLTTGIATGGSMQNYGNGWWRCTLTYTSSLTGNHNVQIRLCDASGNSTYNGTGNQGAYIFGAQLEVGSVATSYIPTTTGSVTRNADVVSVSGAVSGSIGQQSGTIYIECQSEFATNDIIVINTAGQSPGNNFVSITKTPTNVFRLTIFTSDTIILIDQASAITSFAKIAVAYASGNTALFINGTQIGSTNTTGFSFNAALNNITFISNMVTGTKPTRIRAVALYTTRLSNAELAALTSP